MFVYVISQTLFIIYENNRIDMQLELCMTLDIICNASIPVGVITAEIYMYFQFSGSPFFSQNYHNKASKTMIQIYFSVIEKSSLFLGIAENLTTGFKYFIIVILSNLLSLYNLIGGNL